MDEIFQKASKQDSSEDDLTEEMRCREENLNNLVINGSVKLTWSSSSRRYVVLFFQDEDHHNTGHGHGGFS
jgi:hypothetical protein